MSDPSYAIEIRGDVLCAKLVGKWDLATDVTYNVKFTTMAQKIRNRPWGILCDMSDWPLTIKEPRDRSLIKEFDRRNQIAECWVIQNEDQVKALEPFIRRHPQIQLAWFRTVEEADNWLMQQPLTYYSQAL